MTNSFADFAKAKMFFVTGSNMTEAHPVAATFLKNAVRNGAHLIVSDPRRTKLAEFADVHVPIKVGSDVAYLNGLRRGRIVICPLCREAYPAQDGGICRACQGEVPYLTDGRQEETGPEAPFLKLLPVEQAVGRRALHDMTMIIPGASKGPAFEKGQVIGVGDLCRLQQMGRQHLYTMEGNQVGPEWVHEDEAALAFAQSMAGEGVTFSEPPREGKINLLAAYDGLLMVDEPRLERFNLVPGVMCACRQGFSVLTQGRMLGLVGFARNQRLNIYTHPHRLTG
jgi:hypothetical protein